MNTVLDKPLRVAVFMDQKLQFGGGYQQALNAVLLVNKISRETCTPICFTTAPENVAIIKEYGVEVVLVSLSPVQKALLRFRSLLWPPQALRIFRSIFGQNRIERIFQNHRIDLVYFIAPSEMALKLERLNYIVTVWDLSHRDSPEFPEVRADKRFQAREAYYQVVLPQAVGVIVDSEIGKQNVVRRYGLDIDRVHPISFNAAISTRLDVSWQDKHSFDVKKRYGLQEDYVFYPAQFWAHKNHVYILEALEVLNRKYGIRVGAIFSGGNAGGNLAYIRRVADGLGLKDRVRFAGFVPNEDIPHLYRQSIALVMPTYFGPTNLPVLEAFSLGVPVIYSDRHGLREQVGNAGLLVDLGNPESLALAIHKIKNDVDLRATLIERGQQYIPQYDEDKGLETLSRILKEFKTIRKCWE